MKKSLLRQGMTLAFVVVVASSSFFLGRSTTVILSCQDMLEYSDGNLEQPSRTTLGLLPTNKSQHKVQSSTSSSFSINSFTSGWQDSTVVATISFGNATQTNLLERLLYSLKHNGQWQGKVFVLTDNADYYRDQQHLTAEYPHKLVLLQAKPEDLRPIDPKHPEKTLQFITEAMRFKRFKVLLLDYLDDYFAAASISASTSPRNDEPYRHVLYLDVEIVVARPIHGLLQDYQDQMVQREVFVNEHGDVNTSATSFKPFWSFFSDCPKCARSNFNLNGGVFILHRDYSRPCLQEWKQLFVLGADYVKLDQRYLVTMKTATPTSICQFWQLPDAHRLYPSRKDMRTKVSKTIVHNTNTYNAKKIPWHIQKAYFTYLLNTTVFATEALETF